MEQEMYSKDEFIKTAVRRGYSRIGIAQLFVKNNPKDEYTEEDLIELYRFADREPIKCEPQRGRYVGDLERDDVFDMWDRIIDCM